MVMWMVWDAFLQLVITRVLVPLALAAVVLFRFSMLTGTHIVFRSAGYE